MKNKKVKKPTPVHSPVLLWGFLVAFVLFLPYFQIPTAMDISLMPRTLVASIFLVIFGMGVWTQNPWAPRDFSVTQQPLFKAMLLFLLLGVISSLLSYRPLEGIPDTLRIGIWTGVTLISALLFSQTKDWDEKIPWMVALAAFVALWVGFQQYQVEVLQNPSPLLPDGRPNVYKVAGRMSHKNEYSNALMLMIPFLAYGLYRLKLLGKVLCGVALALVLGMVLVLKTRAVWMGIILATYSMVLIGSLYYKQLQLPKTIAQISLVTIALLSLSLLTIFVMGNPGDDFSFRGRIYSLLDFQSSHNVHRLNMWKATLAMAQKSFFGVGPGIWRFEYLQYIGDMFTEMDQTKWVRPHNDYLWVWAEKGYLAALNFIGIFGGLLWMAIRVVRSSQAERHKKILALLLMAGVILFMTSAFFAFPIERINHLVYLGIMGGGIASLHQDLQSPIPSYAKGKNILLAAFGLFFSLGIYYSYKAIVQEQHIKKAVLAQMAGQYQKSIQEAALSRNPLRPVDMANRPLEDYIAVGYERLEMPNEALEAINKGLEYHPLSLEMLNRKGRFHYLRGEYEASAEAGHKALAIIPRSKTIAYNLAAVYIKMGDYEQALSMLKNIPNAQVYPDVVQGIKELETLLGTSNQ